MHWGLFLVLGDSFLVTGDWCYWVGGPQETDRGDLTRSGRLCEEIDDFLQ